MEPLEQPEPSARGPETNRNGQISERGAQTSWRCWSLELTEAVQTAGYMHCAYARASDLAEGHRAGTGLGESADWGRSHVSRRNCHANRPFGCSRGSGPEVHEHPAGPSCKTSRGQRASGPYMGRDSPSGQLAMGCGARSVETPRTPNMTGKATSRLSAR